MHSSSLAIKDLDTIHAKITIAGVGISGVNARQRDETAAVIGPALEDGYIQQGGQAFGGGLR